MIEKAEESFGGIDILVINAGANYDRENIENSNLADFKSTMDVNFYGAYYCAHSAIPFLKKRGAGKIITIGSGLGHRGYSGGAAYSCSKAALWMLTRILAQELIEYNISVNELIPGPVKTSIDNNAKKSNDKNGGKWSQGILVWLQYVLEESSTDTENPECQPLFL